jgi:hypothetical protein
MRAVAFDFYLLRRTNVYIWSPAFGSLSPRKHVTFDKLAKQAMCHIQKDQPELLF